MSTVINNEQNNFAPYNVTLIIAPDPQGKLNIFSFMYEWGTLIGYRTHGVIELKYIITVI